MMNEKYLFCLRACILIPSFFFQLSGLPAQPISNNKDEPHLKYSLKTATRVSYSALVNGFENPPVQSRLHCYWWWLNGMVTKKSITHDLEQMKAKGYGGAALIDAGSSDYEVAEKTPAGPRFMSPQWMKLYEYAVKEADRLGLDLSVNVQSGWNPGGPSITPKMAMKKLVYSETKVRGGQKVNIVLPQPETNLIYQDVMVQAIPFPPENSLLKNKAIVNWNKKSFNQPMGWKGIYPLYELRKGFNQPFPMNDIIPKKAIIDLTACFDGKQLVWDAPPGKWLVIRYGWTCTGAYTSTTSDGWGGLSLDHLNPKAFDLFATTVIQPLIDSAKTAGNSVRFLQTDSWEMGMVNWTNRFPDYFKKFRGYDLAKYMPVMTGRVVESEDVSNRFLHDLRETVGDCVAENHYQLFAKLAHKNGMGIHPESGGPHSAPIDALRVMGISDFPQGEYWARSSTHRISDADRLSVRQSACAAHTNGKRLVAAEGPTSIGPQWERSPKDLKPTIDRIFCAGVNRLEWHQFTSSPKKFGIPGDEYFAGTHLNPNVTWWPVAGDFVAYLNRCSYMLQQGLFVADILYYCGDDVPNFVFLKNEYPELKFGYDWDKCSKDVILNRTSVLNGKIVLPDGMNYRVLVLAPEQSIDLKILKKTEQLVKDGATIIAPRPKEATGLTGYPESDREVTAIADRLWGNINGTTITENQYGKGRVIWGQSVNKVLAAMNIKTDFSFSSPDTETALDYIHRHAAGEDIYYVVNRYARKGINDFKYRYLTSLPDRYEQVECKFRVTGKVPYLWSPMTGQITPVLTYRDDGGQTTVPIHLTPEGSVFVVFKKAPKMVHLVKIEKDGTPLFPGNKFKAAAHPVIAFQHSGSKWTMTAFKSGDYTLYWSNRKIQTILFDSKKENKVPMKGAWMVHFDPKWGGPESIIFHELKSWTDYTEPGIKYYSGKAVYEKNFELKKNAIREEQVLLNLGNLQEMVKVTLNGYTFPLSWEPPYELDVTNYVKSGKNKLKIAVFNLWPNRLIGDGKLPKKDRFTRTNVVKFNRPGSEKLLRKSGLLGPVQIELVPAKKL